MRWHNKPPVNGRELTADDVVFSVNRFLTVKGNANAYMLKSVDKVEAPDKYTVKFTLKEPFVWFLDMLANPHAVAIVAKEVRGQVRRPQEAGDGHRHRPLDARLLPAERRRSRYVRNPSYFLPGLPYIDRIEATVDEDNASRMAAFLSGKYDLGWEFPGTINRVDWVQIKDTLKQKRPKLQTVEFPAPVMSHISMRTDQKPFSDVRVRQAMSLAIDRKAIIDAVFEGVGAHQSAGAGRAARVVDPPRPARRGREVLQARSSRGQAAAGRGRLPNGFPGTMCFTTYGSTILVDIDAARAEGPQGRRHRRQDRPEGVRRLHRDLLLRQLPLDDLRPADARSSSPTTSCSASTTRRS